MVNLEIEAQLKSVSDELHIFTSTWADLTETKARAVISRYVAAVEGNFIQWLAAASVTARSPTAKFAADQNLRDEFFETHPDLLRAFAKGASAEPDVNDYAAVEGAVSEIRKMISELSGLKNTVLIATLESASLSFTPYLAELGNRLGNTDSRYTDAHGDADIEHARLFLQAIAEERKMGYERPSEQIECAILMGRNLLKSAFAESGSYA